MARKPKLPKSLKKVSIESIDSPNEPVSIESLQKSLAAMLNGGAMIEEPAGAVTVDLEPVKPKRRTRRNRVLFQTDNSAVGGSMMGDSLDRPSKRMRDKDLINLASVDPVIASIINTRVSQMSSVGDLSDSMFDKGVRILDTKNPKEKDFETKEAYEAECKRRNTIKDAIGEWIIHCGTQSSEILDEMYEDSDNTFKTCSLKEYLQAQTRNLLTMGRCARQSLRCAEGTLLAFRPMPVETIKPVRPQHKVFLTTNDKNEESRVAVEHFNQIPDGKKPVAFVQEIDGRQEGFFTERDLKMLYYQKQAMIDLFGYPLCPIEFALFMSYCHMNSLTYLRNQFSKGLLNRSIIVISSKDENVEISEEDLARFRRELTNMAARTENSGCVPVVSGAIDVQVRSLETGPRDLEWLKLEQAIIRSLCSAFQIDPSECGFGELGDPAGLSSGNGKENEIVQGEERGLRILVDVVLEDLNSCMFDRFPEAKELGFKLIAIGLGSETREGLLQRLQVEAELTATLNDLYSQSEKNTTASYGGDVPLCTAWHQNVVKFMNYGKFLEVFFSEADASKNPAYDFIIDPNLNQEYQRLKTGGVQAMVAQNQGQVMQVQAGMAQMQQGAPQQQQPKSLSDHFQKSEQLQKSLLESWREIQDE